MENKGERFGDELLRSSVSTKKASSVNTSVNHPFLTSFSSSTVRVFLKLYDRYATLVAECARQLDLEDPTITEPRHPVSLTFCVDAELLESVVDLGFIDDAESYESLDDVTLRKFFDNKSLESKTVMTMQSLNTIIARELRMDMKDRDAKSRMQSLFMSYNAILKRNKLSWVIQNNPKLAVQHICSAVKPSSLQNRLVSDLGFSHHHLRKDFKGFLAHACHLSDAFQWSDPEVIPVYSAGSQFKKAERQRSEFGQPPKGKSHRGTDKKGKAPICVYGPHKKQGVRQFLRKCPDCPADKRKRLFDERSRELAKDGPSKGTRGQTRDASLSKTGRTFSKEAKGRVFTVSRLTKTVTFSPRSTCSITVSDEGTAYDGIGRCDEGSDDNFVSPRLAEATVVKGIGRIKAIAPVTGQVALAADAKPQMFLFSREWTVPRLTFHLAASPLALLNISFSVADDALACEDLLVGQPVLHHLGIDSRTPLEQQRERLHEVSLVDFDYSKARGKLGTIGRIMLLRLQGKPLNNTDHHSKNDSNTTGHHHKENKKGLDPNGPRVDLTQLRREIDPFPDPSLIDPVGKDEQLHLASAVKNMLQATRESGFPENYWEELQQIIYDNVNQFRISFSPVAASIPPLQIKLHQNATPLRVKLRNYSEDQRIFMKNLMSQLLENGIIYRNNSAAWASSPLIVPKAGPARWQFTVDLRHVNRFTTQHHFPMPNLENELQKLKESCIYANFDLSHGYWQLPLSPESQECQSFITPGGVFSPT